MLIRLVLFSLAKDLITHLLCVDPSKRYTIDEFLAHPWIQESPTPAPEPTPLAPPPSIPSVLQMPLDSPLLQAVHAGGYGFREGRSPGINTLKEAFDITYAVHRMEEEGAMRRNVAGARGGGGQVFRQNLNAVDEDQEEDEIAGMNAKYGPEMAKAFEVEAGRRNRERREQQQQQQQGKSNLARVLYDGGRAGMRDQPMASSSSSAAGSGARRKAGGGANFDLDLHGATLLGRRHNRRDRVGGVGEPSPLGRQPVVPPITVPVPAAAHMSVSGAPASGMTGDSANTTTATQVPTATLAPHALSTIPHTQTNTNADKKNQNQSNSMDVDS